MRMTWGSIITAGITASIAVVLFTIFVPQLLGLGTIDMMRDFGMAFTPQSPYIAGAVVLGILGIIWAIVFAAFYNSFPGNYVTKGISFGLIVGIFSLTALPMVMQSLSSIAGAAGQYTPVPFALNTQAIVMMVAYLVFGMTMAWSYRPTSISDSAI